MNPLVNTFLKPSYFLGICLLMGSYQLTLAQKTNLFNGSNLDGWTVYGEEKWYAEEGQIICESGPKAGYGYLATDKSYKDMVLTLEFKQEANGNSGVFFRSSIEGTKITGWQAEVALPATILGESMNPMAEAG